MNIKVLSAEPRNGHLYITFENPNWYNTPEGKRALRILKLHINGGHGSHGRAFVMHGGASARALNSTVKCQTELDRLMNVPIQLKFTGPRVRCSNDSKPLGEMDEIRRAQAAGHQVVVAFGVEANMGFITPDFDAIEKAVRVGVNHVPSSACKVNLVFPLMGPRLKANPWELVKNMYAPIREVIK